MKYLIAFINIFFISAQDADPFWHEISDGLNILIIQRLVDTGDTEQNLKLAIFSDQLLIAKKVKGIDFGNLVKNSPKETNQRLIDNGDKLTEILEDKFHEIEDNNLKFLIASVCKIVNKDSNLINQTDEKFVYERSQIIFDKYNNLYGLNLKSVKTKILSKLREISYKSLSFKSDKLISLINYINKKIAIIDLELEIESLPYCDNLKKILGPETLYMGTIEIEKSKDLRLEEGNLAELIQFIDLSYKVDLIFKKNKIIIRKPNDSHWKNDILSYRNANALAELINSPSYVNLFDNKLHTFQTKSTVSSIRLEKDFYIIHTCPQSYIRVPAEGNEEVCDEIIKNLHRYHELKNPRYLDRLEIFIQADFDKNSTVPKKVHLAYLNYYNKFLKL